MGPYVGACPGVVADVESGDVVVVWDADFSNRSGEANDQFYIVYEKSVLEDSGFVIRGGGFVEDMTARDFAASKPMPQIAPKTAKSAPESAGTVSLSASQRQALEAATGISAKKVIFLEAPRPPQSVATFATRRGGSKPGWGPPPEVASDMSREEFIATLDAFIQDPQKNRELSEKLAECDIATALSAIESVSTSRRPYYYVACLHHHRRDVRIAKHLWQCSMKDFAAAAQETFWPERLPGMSDRREGSVRVHEACERFEGKRSD